MMKDFCKTLMIAALWATACCINAQEYVNYGTPSVNKKYDMAFSIKAGLGKSWYVDLNEKWKNMESIFSYTAGVSFEILPMKNGFGGSVSAMLSKQGANIVIDSYMHRKAEFTAHTFTFPVNVTYNWYLNNKDWRIQLGFGPYLSYLYKSKQKYPGYRPDQFPMRDFNYGTDLTLGVYYKRFYGGLHAQGDILNVAEDGEVRQIFYESMGSSRSIEAPHQFAVWYVFGYKL